MKELTKKEEKVLNERLTNLEYEILCQWGLKNINGGFVHVEMLGYDDDKIYIKIEGGSQDDTGSNVSTHKEQLDRKTLEIIN